MPIDFKKLDERIARLTMLKKVLADPETATLARELLGMNGSGPLTTEQGTFTDVIRQRIAKQSGEFTVVTIATDMEKGGSPVDRSAIGKALSYLENHGEIRIVRHGGPGKPNVYIKTDKLKLV